MSSIAQLLELASFRAAVTGILAADDSLTAELRRSVVWSGPSGTDLQPVEMAGVSQALRAFTILFETAIEEGVEGVVADVRSAIETATDEQLKKLSKLLEPEEGYVERTESIRERDAYLPIMRSSKFALDLRVLEAANSPVVAPVITARLGFDETVNGSDAAVFQIPVSSLNGLVGQLISLQKRLDSIDGSAGPFSVPEWSRE